MMYINQIFLLWKARKLILWFLYLLQIIFLMDNRNFNNSYYVTAMSSLSSAINSLSAVTMEFVKRLTQIFRIKNMF